MIAVGPSRCVGPRLRAVLASTLDLSYVTRYAVTRYSEGVWLKHLSE
jgi:hypothetical protein